MAGHNDELVYFIFGYKFYNNKKKRSLVDALQQ
jgi:hypothetical protein